MPRPNRGTGSAGPKRPNNGGGNPIDWDELL